MRRSAVHQPFIIPSRRPQNDHQILTIISITRKTLTLELLLESQLSILALMGMYTINAARRMEDC